MTATAPDLGQRPVRTSRLPSLTGIRFIAAFLVFLFHASLPMVNIFGDAAFKEQYGLVVGKMGWVGVSFFFILSGFVLTWSQRAGDTKRRFWRRRFLKLYPNHVVTFVAAMLLFAYAYTTWFQAGANLFLVQTWLPDYDLFFVVNSPSWSLSCEALFYLAFPLLIHWIKKIDKTRLWWWAGGTVAAIVAVPVLADLLLPAGPHMPGFEVTSLKYWLVYLLPPVRVLDFVLGILMARIVMTGQWIRLGVLPAALLSVAGYALAVVLPFVYGLNAATVVPLALLIPAYAVKDVRGDRSWMNSRPMTWLGEISFAFYLVHTIVLVYGHTLLPEGAVYSTPEALGLLAAGLVVSLFLSWLLYIGVERPVMRRWGSPPRTTGSGRPAGTATTSSAAANSAAAEGDPAQLS